MQNQEKIIQAIAAYLKRETMHMHAGADGEWVQFGGTLNSAHFTHSGFCSEIAREILAAIAPSLEAGAGEQVKDLQVGAHVKIIAKIETGDRFSHRFQIGHIGTITRVDLSDPLYQYLIDDHDFGWVLANEIELIG